MHWRDAAGRPSIATRRNMERAILPGARGPATVSRRIRPIDPYEGPGSLPSRGEVKRGLGPIRFREPAATGDLADRDTWSNPDGDDQSERKLRVRGRAGPGHAVAGGGRRGSEGQGA